MSLRFRYVCMLLIRVFCGCSFDWIYSSVLVDLILFFVGYIAVVLRIVIVVVLFPQCSASMYRCLVAKFTPKSTPNNLPPPAPIHALVLYGAMCMCLLHFCFTFHFWKLFGWFKKSISSEYKTAKRAQMQSFRSLFILSSFERTSFCDFLVCVCVCSCCWCCCCFVSFSINTIAHIYFNIVIDTVDTFLICVRALAESISVNEVPHEDFAVKMNW